MIYLLLKATHLTAVLTWVGGVIAAGLVLTVPVTETARHALVDRFCRWDRQVTTPAMMLAWALGLWLVWAGGWYGDGWFWIKLVLVTLMSGLHGWLSGQLRRAALATSTDGDGQGEPLAGRAPSRAFPVLTIVLLAAIAVTVIVKPL